MVLRERTSGCRMRPEVIFVVRFFMKRILSLLVFLAASPLLANGVTPENPDTPAPGPMCAAPVDLPIVHKALQDALAVHFDLSQLKMQLETAAADVPATDVGASAAQGITDIVSRLNDAGSELQRSLGSLDDLDNVPLILAQAQARVTAANTKWRALKRLELDTAMKFQLDCLETASRSINDRLKKTLEGFQ